MVGQSRSGHVHAVRAACALTGLMREDVGGLRQRGLGAARRFLGDHQGVFDEAEEADRRSPEAHAA